MQQDRDPTGIPLAGPGYAALRKGRVSIPGARYFLTVATQARRQGLAQPSIFAAMQEAIKRSSASTYALVAMPDHFHWLIQLAGKENTLSQVVGQFKGRLSPVLRTFDLAWQKGAYHDRRLRPDDELSPFLRYMLCNPYRAGILAIDENWPYWFLTPEVNTWFEPMTKNGRPQKAWIEASRQSPWQPQAES